MARDASRFPVVRASAEAVLALHPDLVIGARFGARTTLDLLTRAGIPVERFDLPEDFPGIRAILRDFAARLYVPPGRAAALIERMDATLPLPGPPSRAMVWEPRGWTAGPGGLLDGVQRAAGLVNVGAGGRVGVEALLRRPPDLLVLAEGGGGISRATEMTRQPAIRGIPVRIIPAPLTICPGPFTAGAAAFLVEGR